MYQYDMNFFAFFSFFYATLGIVLGTSMSVINCKHWATHWIYKWWNSPLLHSSCQPSDTLLSLVSVFTTVTEDTFIDAIKSSWLNSNENTKFICWNTVYEKWLLFLFRFSQWS